ncbi:DUF5683 domain-containing protein [Plebeiibacterium marinum]|uniref:DUF5683 domain-containing protein n=1 Tax=Plebeiibacterium marinum TaxID=2992111 RepID=A0AAE3MBA7_9BACT|nr:DUF5683 domain-containing protein [Plebeiobacterium marinum]MCW3804404.1 DUF5683 domain-containing protein [Plebeiobacterium marinum]
MNLLLKNKKGLRSLIILFVLLMVSSHYINAQVDSATVVIKKDVDKSVVIKPHSPHKASLYSAVLPGLGQAYNKKYWKIPILYAGFAGIIYAIDFNSSNYSKYRRGYRDYLLQDPNNTSYVKVFQKLIDNKRLTIEEIEPGGSRSDWVRTTLENGKDYYERWRNLSYVGFALVYIINIVDATVDAHFKTFDVSDDLSMRIDPVVQPGIGGNSVGLQLRLTF